MAARKPTRHGSVVSHIGSESRLLERRGTQVKHDTSALRGRPHLFSLEFGRFSSGEEARRINISIVFKRNHGNNVLVVVVPVIECNCSGPAGKVSMCVCVCVQVI